MKNFRCLSDVKISFEDSPIVTLVGDNESGKTSVVKAFGVVGLNAFSKKQKKYIKDGTRGFGIEVALEDGTKITRLKTTTSNTLSIVKPDGTAWSADKIDSGGIPVQLQNVMGLIEEPETKEYLHMRTYEDQLLFVVTSDSTNYKVMYDALKVEHYSKAIKAGNEQVNELRRGIDTNELLCKDLMENLRDIRITDIEPIVNIKNRLIQNSKLLEKLDRAMQIKQSINSIESSLGNYSLLDSDTVKQIDVSLVDALNSAYSIKKENDNLIKTSGSYFEVSTLDKIDMTLIEKLESSKRINLEIADLLKSEKLVGEIEGLESINLMQYTALLNAIQKYNEIERLQSNTDFSLTEQLELIKDSSIEKINKMVSAMNKITTIRELGEQLESDTREINRLNQILIDSGALISTCPNCGETVVMEQVQ